MKERDLDPILLFKEWFEEAQNHPDIIEPTAFTLATANKEGIPSARILLLKDHSHEGFTFYTNITSRKGLDLKDNPIAALCFHWDQLGKQIRIEGKVKQVSKKRADEYFSTRSRDRQISAWASKQSVMLKDFDHFTKKINSISEDFKDVDIPRPPFWSGYIVFPHVIEFWQKGQYRRHKRDIYKKVANGWQHLLLYP